MKLDLEGLVQTVSQFVDGEPAESASEGSIDVTNPSTGQLCLRIPAGCDADANRAVASARRAFESGRWSDATLSFRKRTLHRLADLIEAEAATLDRLDAEEMGKPICERVSNAAAAANLMRFHAEAVDKLTGDLYGSDKQSFVAQRRVPRGVVAGIVPWNFPTYNAVLKLAPALAAGNCTVLKPSELATRSALRLAHLATQADIPPGVFNVVPGFGHTVGRALALHGDVDMVSFTGSTAVGKQMLKYAAESNMKALITECGGKSPQIVFADCADLDVASESIAKLLLTNQGQLCSAGSRLLVQRSIETCLVEKVMARMRGIVIGDARDPETTFGPLSSAQQCARVMRYIENAQSDGAQLVTGGRRALEASGGYFVEPTVYRCEVRTARIVQEEIFGPVLTVMPFDDEAEAAELANDTIYGLIAYVWTASMSTGMRMAKAIRSSVLVNAAAPGEGPGHSLSFEPAGQSGFGTEGGLAGIESYLRRQVIWINHT